jgi:YHS domain-containing protein
MWKIRITLAFFLILVLVAVSGAQTAPKPPPPTSGPDILTSLGKITLEQVKKNAPGGTETPVQNQPGSRLANVKAVTCYEVHGQTYYFNSRRILVSASSKATKSLTKEQLLKDIKGLEFKKFPPNNVSAAFVKRSSCVIQGFYLTRDGKYVSMTTYDYVCQ